MCIKQAGTCKSQLWYFTSTRFHNMHSIQRQEHIALEHQRHGIPIDISSFYLLSWMLMLTNQICHCSCCDPRLLVCLRIHGKQHSITKLKATKLVKTCSEVFIFFLNLFQHSQLILDIIDQNFSIKSINFQPEARQKRHTKHKCYYQLLLPI